MIEKEISGRPEAVFLDAAEAGMRAALLNRAGNGADWRAGWTVRTLEQLCDLLGV